MNSGCAAGTVITYGDANYTIGLNGTMVLLSKTKATGNQSRPGAGVGPGPRGGFAQNTGRPGGGFQPGPRGGFTQTTGHPGGGFRPGSRGGFAQNTGHPGGGFRPATSGARFGGMGSRRGRRR
jgi:hypothetical protein